SVFTQGRLARGAQFDVVAEHTHTGGTQVLSNDTPDLAVTDEAAYTGAKSLKCVDAKGLAKSFYPIMQVMPRGLDKGSVTLSFAIMLHATAPAPLAVEFRGAGGTNETGPTLRFQSDGRILAGGQEVLSTPPGTWTHVEVAFRLGDGAPKTYTLTLKQGDATTQQTLPVRHDAFGDVRWLGFIAADDVDGVCYLDDMKLSLGE
ncbi:MAG: hypothetical protein U1E05_25400, partial [Patescibacteria group bacterium]|nr:hypothetical protein [Patescibacteria group bacterium]